MRLKRAVVICGAGRYDDPWHPFAETSDALVAQLDQMGIHATVHRSDAGAVDTGGVDLVVKATTLVRDLTVFPDRLLGDAGKPLPARAVASEALLTLLPGESARIHIPGASIEHAQALTGRPVLRAANDTEELAPAG